MPEELLSPKVDFVFKALFGQEHSKPMLISLLNAVLERTDDDLIIEVELLTPELGKQSLLAKGPVLDIRAKDQLARIFDIEIQCQWHTMFRERMVYYWAQIFGNQLRVGHDYDKLRPVLSIVFTDFKMFAEIDRYHTCWMWQEREAGVTLTDMGQIHFIELPKFTAEVSDVADPLEKWVFFLKEGDKMSPEIVEKWKDENYRKALEELERLSQDPAMRMEYDSRMRMHRDYYSGMALSYKEGLREGEEIGEKRGEERGKQEGLSILEAGLREAICSIAQQRFPRIRKTTLERLDLLNHDELQQLLKQIFDFEDVAAFRNSLPKA